MAKYDEMCADEGKQLHAVRDEPVRTEELIIYHLSVSPIYHYIILMNPLRPHAICPNSAPRVTSSALMSASAICSGLGVTIWKRRDAVRLR